MKRNNQIMKTNYNTNRNVTVDNWFTSFTLSVELQNNGLTLVGTLRKNKPELIIQFSLLSLIK
jgi:hypothetical protein